MLLNRLENAALVPFHALTRELDRMFEGLRDGDGAVRNYPAITILAVQDSFHIEAEVPGLTAEDLDISATGKRVTIRGERKETPRENATVHRQEWRAFQFERTFELPTDVDGKDIRAELQQGILRLTLPKT